MALFKLGSLLEIHHRNKHEKRIAKRFLRQIHKQKLKERALARQEAAEVLSINGEGFAVLP